MWALILSLATNPDIDAAIASAFKSIVDYIEGLPAEKAAAAKATLEAVGNSVIGQVAAFVTGSAADLATAQATLAQLEQHPAVVGNESVAGIVANLKAQLAERVKPIEAPAVPGIAVP